MTAGDPAPRPLFVTDDDVLLDDLLRLAAGAGVSPDLAADAPAARRYWSSAPLVLVGADLVDAVIRTDPLRRDGVCMVTRDPDDASVWRRAVDVGAETVVALPAGEAILRELLADTVDGGPASAVTLSVVGGCGGAGASVLASALGVVAAARQLRTLLVDGDPLGGGIDLVLGGEKTNGLRWPDLIGTSGRVSAPTLRAALPDICALAVLSWDRGNLLNVPADLMRAVIAAGQRGGDLVVIDLPRRLDAAVEEALVRSTSALLVVPAQVRAVAAAARVARQLRPVAPDLRLVVRGPSPSGLDGHVVADTLDLPLAAEMRAQRSLDDALELGHGPSLRSRDPLTGACARVLDGYRLAGKAAA